MTFHQGVKEKCEELEAKIQVLEDENALLSERAEETLLLRLVAESISFVEERDVLVANVLERISILKNIPYGACYALSDSSAQQFSAYAAFSESARAGDQIGLSSEIMAELKDGAYIITGGDCEAKGVLINLKEPHFAPYTVAILPFEARSIPRGIFVFIDDDRSGNRLSPMIMLLQQVVDMTAEKLDIISLVNELKQLNADLERKVAERTRELSRSNKNLRGEILERKRAEEALRESEEKYRNLFEYANDSIFIVDPSTRRFLDVNENAARRLGYTQEELLQLSIDDLYGPTAAARNETIIRELQETGSIIFEHLHQRKDGTEMPVEISSQVIEYGARQVIQSFARDITARKRAEDDLRNSEEKFRTIVTNAQAIIFMVDNNGIFLLSEGQGLSALGLKPGQVVGASAFDMYKDYPDIVNGINKALSGKVHKDMIEVQGMVFDTFYSPYKDSKGNIIGAIGMSIDITDLKRAEVKIRQRNRELALLNQVIAASAADLEPELVLETACRELALAFDLPQAAAVLLNQEKTEATVVAEYLAEGRPAARHKTIPVADTPLFQHLLTHKAPLVVDDVQTDPRLSPIHDLMRQRGVVSLLILPLIVEDEVVGSLGLNAIKARRFSTEEINLAWSVADQMAGALARDRLAQTYRLLTTAIEQATESVIITDTNDKIIYVNPAFEQVSGYSRAEVVGQSPDILSSGKHDDAFFQELWETITSGQVWYSRIINKKKDGTLYTEEITISPIRDKSGNIINFVEVKRDVTRELELEEQYRQAQKMESIGQLAGGVAHDFNNLLTAIIGYASLPLYLNLLPPDHPVRSDLQNIQQIAERAANLTRQLLTFARRQVIESKVLNLSDLVLDIDKMLRRLIGEDIELVTLPASNLGWVKADPGQIEQVLLNLAVNARDAMPSGGSLTIEITNTTLDEDYASRHAEVTPGRYVMLAVSDTGIGMTEEIKARIFEPFFTTKEAGKGTGLGLATVFGIVKQSGGHIWVYSEPGQGSTFKIYLPRIEKLVSPVPRQDKSGDLPRGTETVLLVEDEASVRELGARTLRELGYNVIEAANGEEALYLAREHGGEIHLLFTDVVMPKMGGRVLADKLTNIYPQARVLFTSGYTDSAIVHHGVLDPDIAFIQKPFSPAALTRKIREVLA